jgi:mannose/fructose/N-acetylgalactosamine-specific phosphotransferase system component IIC
MRGFNLCGWTSVIVPAFFVGFAVATVAGSDVVGWIAALVVGVAIAAYQVRSGRSATCALPPTPAASAEDEPATTRR